MIKGYANPTNIFIFVLSRSYMDQRSSGWAGAGQFLIHDCTQVNPSSGFFHMWLLPAAIATNSNHCVLSAGKAPCQAEHNSTVGNIPLWETPL